MHSQDHAVTLACRLTLAVATALCSASLIAPACARADLPTRTAAEIQARYAQIAQPTVAATFAVAPSLKAPFSAGELSDASLQRGLDALNYARFLAGLPDDVVLDARLTSHAQHGAVLIAVGQFAHTQSQPSGMDAEFFREANAATQRSNLGMGYDNLWEFNVDCMCDSDASNIGILGHRRWLLNPPMAKTGMGLAGQCTDTYIGDFARTTPVAYDTIKWPAAGDFPAEMMPYGSAWSVTLNPSAYSWVAGSAGHKVVLTRQRDGKSWTFTSADRNAVGEYFNFDTGGYGVANCFIFRPKPSSVGRYQNGDVFTVRISGGITSKATGRAATISYRTQIVSQSADTTICATATSLRGPAGVKARRTLTVRGSVTPSCAGKVRVTAQRLSGGRWVSASSKMVSASRGRFAAGFKLKKRGRYRLCATFLGAVGARAFSASHSGYVAVHVR